MPEFSRRAFAGMIGLGLIAPQVLRADIFRNEGLVYADNGRAVRGADVVAYFDEGQRVEGSDHFATEWRGALWCFASADHQAEFEANPRAFAPRYGGYCAYAMSLNMAIASDPVAWRIHDKRLYLFHTDRAIANWEADVAGNIARADANWPGIRRKLAG